LDLEELCQCARNERRLRNRREIEKPRARRLPARRFEREPRLADAARSVQRDEAARAEQRFEFLQFAFATVKRRDRERKMSGLATLRSAAHDARPARRPRLRRRRLETLAVRGRKCERRDQQFERFALRRFARPAFERADRLDANACAFRQRFLRQSGRNAKFTQQSPENGQPPAIAPTIIYGSSPATTAGGKGSSGD
jgi:hypothetical protein